MLQRIGRMAHFIVAVFMMSAALFGTLTDALKCPTCTYAELPQEFKDAGITDFGGLFGSDTTCRDGGSSLTSFTCESPEDGKKAVCIQSKGDLSLTFKVQSQEADLSMTMYSRGCHVVADSEPATGTIPTSEFEDEMDDLFDALNSNSGGVYTVEVTDVSGAVQYCSTDDCGKTDDIASLSGVGALLPSLLLATVLAVFSRIF